MEYAPYSSGKVRMTSSEKRRMAAKIKKGGLIADQIRKDANAYHENTELPQVETLLEKELQRVDQQAGENQKSIPTGTSNNTQQSSSWKKLLQFLRRIFIP